MDGTRMQNSATVAAAFGTVLAYRWQGRRPAASLAPGDAPGSVV
jgi:hypothetical protein